MTTLSVIIPASDRPKTLDACLAAIAAADRPPDEVVVVDDEHVRSPASARNLGALRATGDILVFVDADVTVHRDSFERVRDVFEHEDDVDALFGSYDDDPPMSDAISGFRNLLHHHVHQNGAGDVQTFWAGFGAVRRRTFERLGGFSEHPVEDIELGMRLHSAGAKIRLDPQIQCSHLKRWGLWSMIRTDLLVRGAPWVGLLLRHRSAAVGLNLGWRHRLSALASLAFVVCAALLLPLPAVLSIVVLVALNLSFYRLLLRRRGVGQAFAGVVLHLVHHLVSIAAVVLGVVQYVVRRRRPREAGIPVQSPTA